MSNASRQALAGLLVGLVVGAGLYWLVREPTLAIAGGVAWGGAVGVTVHFVARFPDHATGSGWADSRWTGLGVAIVTFAGLLGVNGLASLATGEQFALGAVVLGVGYAGYVAGAMAERERPDG